MLGAYAKLSNEKWKRLSKIVVMHNRKYIKYYFPQKYML